MESTRKTAALTIGVLFFIACVGVAIVFYRAVSMPSQDMSEEFAGGVVSTTTVDRGDAGAVVGSGSYIVEEIPLPDLEGIASEPSLPKLDRPVTFPSFFPEDARGILGKQIASTTATLTKDPRNIAAWFDLALQRKLIDDYEGAREIWEYLKERFPDNSVSFGNLGELYHLYLKDYPKSEANYRRAIENEPSGIALYRGLHELYKYSYKTDTTAAADALLEGLKKNSENAELLILLGHYYRERGEVASARGYYERALAAVAGSGLNRELEDQLRSILSDLK